MSQGAFSVGIPWNYYDYNKYYVPQKYENLKEEILEYKYIDAFQYLQEILPKAEGYHKTELVASMKSAFNYHKYNIKPKESISVERIMCIILYTDYTQHSSQFTSTFRKNNKFEPLQAIKKRHTKFYWMGRLLQETIKVYGERYNVEDQDKGLCGPFFTGMSMVMNMPEFNMQLLSPTSTSCQIAVSIKV